VGNRLVNASGPTLSEPSEPSGPEKRREWSEARVPSEAHEDLVRTLLANPLEDDIGLDQWRESVEAALEAVPVPEDVNWERVDANGVGLEWVSAEEARDDLVILVVHGGGYILGSAQAYREYASRLSRAAGARCAVVDYRLAPEHPYPAAVDDCFAAYRWLLQEGVGADRIVLVGDSAGGGLALSMLTRSREDGTAMPAGAVAFSPWVDLSGELLVEPHECGDPMLSVGRTRRCAEGYLDGHSAKDPNVNALFGSLAGLPPLLVFGSTRDIGYSDAVRLTLHARASGMEADLRTYHGLIHAWPLFSGLPESGEALHVAAAFVRERTVSPAPQLPKEAVQ
jgi:epsilon-lactone hydrolase